MKMIIDIPDNVTNGDIIKAMFPEAKVRDESNLYTEYSLDGIIGNTVDKKWWNTLYIGGKK